MGSVGRVSKEEPGQQQLPSMQECDGPPARPAAPCAPSAYGFSLAFTPQVLLGDSPCGGILPPTSQGFGQHVMGYSGSG